MSQTDQQSVPNPQSKLLATNRVRNSPWLIVFWWLATLGVLSLLVFRAGWSFVQYSWPYLTLWIGFSLMCLFFASKYTFSVVLGRGIEFLELPVYLSFAAMGLIGIFGFVPYIDQGYLLSALKMTDLPAGLVLVGFGMLIMWSGYALTVAVLKSRVPQRRVQAHSSYDLDAPYFGRTMGLYVFLAILRLALYQGGGAALTSLGSLSEQLVLYMIEVPWLLLALITVQVVRGRWPSWSFVAVLLVEIALSVLSGFSSSLLKIIFLLIGCFAYARKRPSYILILATCLAAFFLTPIARVLRNTDLSNPDSIVTAVTAGPIDAHGTSTTALSYNQDLLVARQTGTAQLPALILSLTPSGVPFRPVEELVSIPFSFIPRALWPDKAQSGSKGTDFAVDYLGLSGNSSAATTIVGSAYMYGGWIVVAVMMALAGVVFALTYYMLMLPAINSQQIGLFALYAGLVIANFHLGEGDIAGLWQGLVQRTVVYFFFLLILCVRRPGTRALKL